MMNKRAIKHHIVPQVLQRQFAIRGDEQRIWRAKRNKNGNFQSLERKRIAKTFVINNNYTVLENDQPSDVVERKFYGPIDDFLGRFLPDVIQTINNGYIPNFSTDSLNSIKEIAIHMAKRTPDFLGEDNDIERGRKLVEEILQYTPDVLPTEDRKQLEADLTDESRLRDKGRDIRVKATLQNSSRIKETLSQFVPRWAVSQTKHSFILASRMVYRIGNGGPNGLTNPKVEIWMPITPKIALVLLRDPENKVPHIVVDRPQHIRRVNEYAVRESFEVASHSERLLYSLTGL